jgi:hypothetical protein
VADRSRFTDRPTMSRLPYSPAMGVVMTQREGSHGDQFWQDEFPLMVAWAFGE